MLGETLRVQDLEEERIAGLAEALLIKIEEDGWAWSVAYHPDDRDLEPSHWDLTGTNKESGDALTFIITDLDWEFRVLLTFTMDGKTHVCPKSMCEKPQQPFHVIKERLYDIALEIRMTEDVIHGDTHWLCRT